MQSVLGYIRVHPNNKKVVYRQSECKEFRKKLYAALDGTTDKYVIVNCVSSIGRCYGRILKVKL